MLGYKIYFNGDKFVADNTATEVQTMPCDSTISWMANKTYADDAVEAFDEFSQKHKEFVREFAKYRGDFISSDREAAAFMFALESMMEEDIK